MLDVAALKRRAGEAVRSHRPAAIAFLASLFFLFLAAFLLLTPALADLPPSGTLPRRLARFFAIAFGPAAVVLALVGTAHALLHLFGRGIRLTPPRIAASAGLALLLPCFFGLMDSADGASGGVLGVLGRDAVLALLPEFLAVPVLAAMALLALALATDWLFFGAWRVEAAAVAVRPAPVVEVEEPEEAEPQVEAEPEIAEEADVEAEEEEPEAEAPEIAGPPDTVAAPMFPEIEQVVAAEPQKTKRSGTSPMPPVDLLEPARAIDIGRVEQTIQHNGEVLEKTLASFRIEARVVGWTRGPVVTMYELALKEGTKLSQIVNLSDDLAIALKAESVRIVAPIPGKNTVGAEVPNLIRDDVRLHTLLKEHIHTGDRMAVPLYLGCDATGRAMIEDLAGMPHLLIAGATGSGKSVCINSIILSILLTRRPEEVRLILIDPKQVELAFFREIPHLLSAVVTDSRKAAQTLEWAVSEMEDRYWIFARFGVRNIAAYNRLGAKRVRQLAKEHDIGEEKAPVHMPYLVIVVDELADLIMTGRKEVEQAVTRLAQKSRAVGIHTVLATQRPSADVITGLIKANMPCRASFKVTSKVDSRVVLDQNGAEKLLGKGDMLFLPPRSFHLVRCQGTYISDAEVKSTVDYLKENGPKQELRELLVRPETLDDRDPREVDDLFDTACRVVLNSQRGSASLLQRALQIGYTRASRLIDLMRAQGIIGEFKNAQAAEVLLTLEEYEARYQ